MRLLFTILVFIWMSSSLSAQGFPPYFKEFFLGNSYEEVQKTLKTHQSYLKEATVKQFVLDLPLFLYLTPLKEQGIKVDLDTQRIYLDDTNFFDFTDQPWETPAYQFYYENSYYYLSFKEILNYQAVYPSRINPNLISLKFKFFQNQLYSIEYEAILKNYEINRFRQNYLENFGQKLDQEENTFFTSLGMYVVKIFPSENRVRVIQMSLPLYRKLEAYLENQISDVLSKSVRFIQDRVNRSIDLKPLFYQERKKILKEKIRRIYQSVDEL